jgi:hypothetical protein
VSGKAHNLPGLMVLRRGESCARTGRCVGTGPRRLPAARPDRTAGRARLAPGRTRMALHLLMRWSEFAPRGACRSHSESILGSRRTRRSCARGPKQYVAVACGSRLHFSAPSPDTLLYMNRRVAGLCVLLALVTPSCINIRNNLGVSLDSGSIVLRYEVCRPGEVVTAISLARPLGEPPWGNERVILWRVETRHVPRSQFQVGVTPPGFDEAVPLERPLPRVGTLELDIDTTHYKDNRFFFSLGALREGSIYRPDPNDYVTVRAFDAEACD